MTGPTQARRARWTRRAPWAIVGATLVVAVGLAAPGLGNQVPAADNASSAGNPVATEQQTGPAVVHGHGRAIHSEGVTWDPTRRAFLVGSLRHGTVSVVHLDGRTEPLVTDPRLVATGGIRVDPLRDRLYVTYDDVFAGPDALLSVRSTPQTRGRHAGLGVFELDTGRTLRLVDLGFEPGRHLANDVALDPAGNAYVTDSFSDAIYRVNPDGTVSILVRDPAFDARRADGRPSVGMNGILWHPSGCLLAVRYDTGRLFRIPLDQSEQFTEVRLDQPVTGADGIAPRPDGTLLVATNTIRADGIDGVFRLRSADIWQSAQTLSREAWPDPAPTTAAITPHGDYVLSSHADLLFGSGGRRTADGLTLRRVN